MTTSFLSQMRQLKKRAQKDMRIGNSRVYSVYSWNKRSLKDMRIGSSRVYSVYSGNKKSNKWIYKEA
jgi:hypothetical protein